MKDKSRIRGVDFFEREGKEGKGIRECLGGFGIRFQFGTRNMFMLSCSPSTYRERETENRMSEKSWNAFTV